MKPNAAHLSASRNRPNGFSYVEVMVAVSIVGIVMSTAIPRLIRRAPEYRADRAVSTILMDLRQARMQAVAEETTAVVTFNSELGEYLIWVDSNQDGQRDSEEQITRSPFTNPADSLWAYPSLATFTPEGECETTWDYLYIGVYVPEVGYKQLYVFPSGYIDIYHPPTT